MPNGGASRESPEAWMPMAKASRQIRLHGCRTEKHGCKTAMRGCKGPKQVAKLKSKFAKRKSIDAKPQSKSPNSKASLQNFFSEGQTARITANRKSQERSGKRFTSETSIPPPPAGQKSTPRLPDSPSPASRHRIPSSPNLPFSSSPSLRVPASFPQLPPCHRACALIVHQ